MLTPFDAPELESSPGPSYPASVLARTQPRADVNFPPRQAITVSLCGCFAVLICQNARLAKAFLETEVAASVCGVLCALPTFAGGIFYQVAVSRDAGGSSASMRVVFLFL